MSQRARGFQTNGFFYDHGHFLFFYGTLFIVFLWPLLLFQKTFIFGDYWQQHYPWAYEYARLLKTGRLPYWVPGVASGFPLVAEGQVGAYYLPHLILYRLLPFSVAYTLVITLHVLFGGVGFYIYGKKIGLSREAATITALLFSFSSSYGGCFSNTATLRVLAWLPWCFLIWENLILGDRRKRFFWISLLGGAFSQMWTGGSQQAALYAMGYLFCLWMAAQKGKYFFDYFMASTLGVLLSLPQWVATLELIPVSVRASESSGFALWGSVMPPAILSLIYPGWGAFLGVSFYIGASSVALLLFSLLSKKTTIEKAHWLMAIFFFLIAIGKYNPAYAFLIEKFSLTMLRNPSKFLFFSTISLIVATGFGFDHLRHLSEEAGASRRFSRSLYFLLGFVALLPFLSNLIFGWLRGPILDFARQSAAQAYYQKKDPAHDLASYQARAEAAYHQIKELIQYSNAWNLFSIVLFLIACLIFLKMIERGKHRQFLARIIFPAILMGDLFIFGLFFGSGFTGNIRSYPDRFPEQISKMIQSRQALDSGALMEWAEDMNNELLPANTNLLYSLRHAGGYSPLLIKRYYELSKELGISDSSLGQQTRSEAVWNREFPLIQALGVDQILSSKELVFPGTELVSTMNQESFLDRTRLNDKRYLYGLKRTLPLIYAVYDWKVIPEEKERLSYLKQAEFRPFEEAVLEGWPAPAFQRHPGLDLSAAQILSREDIEVEASILAESDATVIFRNAYYPRWKAEVDGHPAALMPVNHVFSGVFLKKGMHRLRFFYETMPQRFSEVGALTVAIFLCIGTYFNLRDKKL